MSRLVGRRAAVLLAACWIVAGCERPRAGDAVAGGGPVPVQPPRTARTAEIGFALGVTASFEKVFAEPPHGFTGTFEADVELAAARNEVEGAQLVLFPERDVDAVSVEMTPLRGPGDAVIPRDDMEVRVVGHVDLLEPKIDGGRDGWHPDPLLPNHEVALDAGVPQAFLIAVRVRAGTPPGRYGGRAIVRTGEGEVEEREVRLEVWDVALPRTPSFRSSSFAGWTLPGRMWPREAGYPDLGDERRLELMLRVADLGFEYRLPPTLMLANGLTSWNQGGNGNTTYGFPTHDLRPDGRPVFNARRTDRLIDYMLDRGTNHFFIAATANVWRPAGIAEDRQRRLVEYLTEYRRHLAARGLLDMAYVYNIDEPWGEEVEHARRIYRLIRDRVGSDLRVMQNTNQNNPTILSDLLGFFDVADINLGFYDVTNAASYRRLYPDAFEELWWNVNQWPASHPNLFIEYPLSDARIIGSMSYAYGISGFEYWGLLYPAGMASYHPIGPDERRVRWGVGRGSLDGTLIYPGAGYELYPSLRLAALRDGFEDFELLRLLEETEPDHPLLRVPIVRGLTDFARSPGEILGFRRDVAEAIAASRRP